MNQARGAGVPRSVERHPFIDSCPDGNGLDISVCVAVAGYVGKLLDAPCLLDELHGSPFEDDRQRNLDIIACLLRPHDKPGVAVGVCQVVAPQRSEVGEPKPCVAAKQKGQAYSLGLVCAMVLFYAS